MSENPTKRQIGHPVVSPQNTGDLRSTTDGGKDAYVVSPMSADLQLQREIDLSYPEVYLGKPEVATFHDGADAPEVVPANNPGYYADGKYMPPRLYRNHPDNTRAEKKEEKRGGGAAVPVTVVPQQHSSGFDAESETQETDTGADSTAATTKRKLYLWIGIAAAVLVFIALAVGLGVGLGTRSSSNDNDDNSTATSSTTVPFTTTTTTTSIPTSTTLRCPASNGTTYTTNNKTFTIECGIDHSGGNIDTLDAENITACIDSCSQEEQCVGATFLGAACYLKGEWSEPVFGNREVAGGKLIE